MIEPTLPDQIDQRGSVGPFSYQAWTASSFSRTYVEYVVYEGDDIVKDRTSVYRNGRLHTRTCWYHTCESLRDVEPALLRLYLFQRHQAQVEDDKRPLTEQLYTLYREGALAVYTRSHSDVPNCETSAHDIMRRRRVGPHRNELGPNQVETFRYDGKSVHRIKTKDEMALEHHHA